MTVLSIRGTSGSGKSHLARELMRRFSAHPIYVNGRARPLYYRLTHYTAPGAVLLGSYENECGGADTLKSVVEAVGLAQRVAAMEPTYNLILEGLLASEDVKHSLTLRPGLQVILLTTPVEECLAAVRERRLRRGNTTPLREDNTRKRVEVIQRACYRLERAGVPVWRLDRRAAVTKAVDLLGLPDGW